MRLIDKDKLLHALCMDCANKSGCRILPARCSEYRLITNAPEVAAVPVVYGRWEMLADGRYYCSQCQQSRGNGWGIYCGYCGAKMEVNDKWQG